MSEFEKYDGEAREKWGDTPAYREYAEKTKDYSEDKKETLAKTLDDIIAEFAECRKSGEMPDSEKAQSLVGDLQAHITESYYRCTPEILAGLGQMYVLDERFKRNIDRHAEGTAFFIFKAIEAYCIKINKKDAI
ncbi:MAG: TipAS antibiotic-recognition domain-containing protein [Oscillospiraceae bacterium]|nr:TipAS antibiotic-recognition domain-containing protein [Oscillospiraceae bacterium]